MQVPEAASLEEVARAVLLDEHLPSGDRRVHLYRAGALAAVIEMLPTMEVRVAVVLDDRDEILDDAHADAWRAWLRLSNALAARDWPTVVTTTSDVVSSIDTGYEADEHGSRPVGAWADVYDAAAPGAERELVAALANHGLIPPVIGVEGPDGIPLDLSWPDLRVAVAFPHMAPHDRADLASGVLIGLIYALVAIGLTMIFGVMDIVNFAHGEFLMLGMYASFWMFALVALDPMFTLPLTVLMLFAFGVLLYRVVVRRIIDAPPLSQIFTTFGLMLLMRGLAQFFWKPDYRTIENSLVAGSIKVAGVQVGRPQLVAGLGAVLVTAVIYFFLNRTKLGAALEATAADKEAARLMGIDSHKMFALAWGTAAACAGAAGGLLSTFFPIFPDVGANFILLAFVVVNLGGFGSVMGAFWAGIIVGVIEVMGGLLLGPQYKTAIVLVLFLGVLMFRPQGLLGRA